MKQHVRAGISILLAMILVLSLSGCKDKKAEVETADYIIYHINADGTALVASAYNGNMKETKPAIEEMLAALQKPDETIEEQPAISTKVKLEEYELQGEKLSLYFNAAYKKLSVVQEILTRAAVVRSLTQIPGVALVGFFVDGVPLTNKEGAEYGFQQAEDFVQNTGSSINSFEATELTLYYASASGESLVAENISVRYNSNISKERLIVEKLMKGTKTEGQQRTIPQGTKLLGVSVKDGVCYINFDEGLNKAISGVRPDVTIYSIVNSVTESGTAGRVQVSINGDSNLNFQESVELAEPLGRNLDLVEGK